MEEVLHTRSFLVDVKNWEGEVQALKVVDAGKEHVYLKLRIGNRWIYLPRSSVLEITSAIHAVKHLADEEYKKILRRMNK